ncbi:MAG: MgtC/SapB family protein [Anaerohalosphaeraceae bacterium]
MDLDFWNWPFWMPFFSSVLLGGLIGLEREIRRKPAGLRTNILICLAASLFTHLALSISDDSLETASRILQGVITGVGFIGAGAVIRGTHETHGITTAATIWLVTGIGIACGFGLYEAAVGVTVIALIILWGLIPLDRRLRNLENDRTRPDNPF